jgi:transposase
MTFESGGDDDDRVGHGDHNGHQHRHDHHAQRRIEIFTGPDRRRRWPPEVKQRILEESLSPGTNVSAVARAHDMSIGLLHHWRRAAKSLANDAGPLEFVPVVAGLAGRPRSMPPSAAIEIEIGDARVRVGAGCCASF